MKQPDDGIGIEVVAYSGYRADERPLKIVIGGVAMEVTEIVDRWYGEDFDYFKVRVNTGAVHLIARHRTHDRWYLKGTGISRH
jgi:hypothetical protein